MFPRLLVVLLLFASTLAQNERRLLIESVRSYLQHADNQRQIQAPGIYLPNSNKIGYGYNLLAGSPGCYTGGCQMTDFTHPIFKLNYTSAVPGTCTDKLVPNNVNLVCIPATSFKVDSEIMDSVEHIHKSISNKITVSVGARYKGVGFSYSYSTETAKMVDSIVKNYQSAIYTAVDISFVKLSMFESAMELTDNFRFVIENMPCCEEDDSDIVEYVTSFILNNFGFTYINSVILGGVAQQTIFINREAKERLEHNQVNIAHQAQVSFGQATGAGAELGITVSNSKNDSNYISFMNETQSIHTVTKGGATQLVSLVQWSKTIEDNPEMIKFEIRDIFRILTKQYFPQDQLITNKSKLIEQILDQYLNGSDYCYNNCGGNGTRGTCVPSGYFKFGICKCKPGWTGYDCQTEVLPPKILHGTICGFDRSFMRVNCNGVCPWVGCPQGWIGYNWPTDLTVCYKDQTEIGAPVFGTLCGLHSFQSTPYSFEHDISCSTAANVLTGICPSGYQRYTTNIVWLQIGLKWYARRNAVCAVMDAEEHLSGTLCGMQIQDTTKGPSCDGSNPGLGRCPPDYALQYTAFNNLGFMVCVKK